MGMAGCSGSGGARVWRAGPLRLLHRAAAAARVFTSQKPSTPTPRTGFSSVALAAYGAHALKTSDPHFQEVWKRANSQQFYHTALLAIAPLAR
jgi:hypothetical protein